MKIKLSELKTERQWRAATGLDQIRFEKLLVLFTANYLRRYGNSVTERQAELEISPSLTSEEELLFFTLFSLKSGLTYDLLGLVCGLDATNAKRNQTLGLESLEQTLQEAQCLPKRNFKDIAEFTEYLKNEDTLIFDGTEQRLQRPENPEVQRDHYSGKKVSHG